MRGLGEARTDTQVIMGTPESVSQGRGRPVLEVYLGNPCLGVERRRVG